MTYLEFHFVFIIPAIVLIALFLRKPWAGEGKRALWALPVTILIAFVYTTPWDNYLVYREVWYYGPDRVLFTIGYVPIEEYLFFILQPIMTGLLLYVMLQRHTVKPMAPEATRWVGVAMYGLISAIGAGLLLSGWDRGLYMGLILAWAGPVLAGLWYYGGPHFWAQRKPALLTIGLSTSYLWVADKLAIQWGIWDITLETSLGWRPFGLPIEEATFFLVTNLLCVQGILLFLHGYRVPPPWLKNR